MQKLARWLFRGDRSLGMDSREVGQGDTNAVEIYESGFQNPVTINFDARIILLGERISESGHNGYSIDIVDFLV